MQPLTWGAASNIPLGLGCAIPGDPGGATTPKGLVWLIPTALGPLPAPGCATDWTPCPLGWHVGVLW